MNGIEELLRSKGFAANLLNGPCPSKKDKNDYTPINPDWIDEKASDAVTDAFHKLLPCSFPYMTYIVVEMNPDRFHGGTCVDANDKRLRYFVITVIPDTKYPYDFSYPLIHEMWTVCDRVDAEVKAVESEIQKRQSCGRRIEALIAAMEEAGEDFTESLWESMVENVTIFEDGPVFTLTSGEEVRVAPC